MEITSIQINKAVSGEDKNPGLKGQMVGTCSLLLDGVFLVRGIRMIRTADKQFLVMPYRTVNADEQEHLFSKDWNPKDRRKVSGSGSERQTLAFPVVKSFADHLNNIVFNCFDSITEEDKECVRFSLKGDSYVKEKVGE